MQLILSGFVEKEKKPAEVKIDGRQRPCKVSTWDNENYMVGFINRIVDFCCWLMKIDITVD